MNHIYYWKLGLGIIAGVVILRYYLTETSETTNILLTTEIAKDCASTSSKSALNNIEITNM